ncbi:MAG: hypothetical protein PF482_08250, partial [Desulfobacteraceae bacterium]|nr:hypothetical protein [Desulfobacteraceae bacterium]
SQGSPPLIQGLATRWIAILPGRDSHPLKCTTLPGRTTIQDVTPYPNMEKVRRVEGRKRKSRA